jgi:lysophospholipase L1-like esterase
MFIAGVFARPTLSRLKANFALQVFHSKHAPGDLPSIRISIFDQIPLHTNDIVFLGDSIFNFGEWQELMGDARAKNRAISGDDTSMILKRLDQIVSGRAAHIILLCGINNFQKGIPFEQTTNEYAQIVDRLLFASPETQVWLLPAFPVQPELYRRWITPGYPGLHMPEQVEVEKLNLFIRQLAAKEQIRVHYVPIPGILGKSGQLADDFTPDGLHLNGRGLSQTAEDVKAAMSRPPLSRVRPKRPPVFGIK